MNGDAQCVICYRIIWQKTLFNIRRHYSSCHCNYDKLSGADRTLKLLELKADLFLNLWLMKLIFKITVVHLY